LQRKKSIGCRKLDLW